MEIRINLDDHMLARCRGLLTRRRVALALAVAIAAGSTAVYAIAPTPTHTFVSGTTISSTDVNENFDELYAAVNSLEAAVSDLEASSITHYGSVYLDPGVQCTLQATPQLGVTSATLVGSFCDIALTGLAFDHTLDLALATSVSTGVAHVTSNGANDTLRIFLENASAGTLVNFLVIAAP
jgi:hypothetical protein